MRVVTLEEHFTVPALARRIDPGAISRRGFDVLELGWAEIAYGEF
jgi:hypothetical protein